MHKITPLTRDRVPDILAFLRTHYGDGYYGADETYFRWFFLDGHCDWFAPAAAAGQLPANGILGPSGELQALHLYLPFDVVAPSIALRGIFDEEWVNGSEIRGLGRILASYLLDSVDVYCGFGCNDLSEMAFRKLGLDCVPEVPRLVAILDRQSLKELLSCSGYASEARHLPENTKGFGCWVELGDARAIPTSVFAHYREITPLGVNRSAEWLEWRYDRSPYIRYHYISPDITGAKGVAVVRLESVMGTPLQNARIVDLLPGPSGEGELLAAALGFSQDHGCLIADFSTTSTTTVRRASVAALSAGIEFHFNPRVPYMFQPCEFGPRNNYNMVFSANFLKAGRLEGCDFHAVKGDSTQDVLRTRGTAPVLQKRLQSLNSKS